MNLLLSQIANDPSPVEIVERKGLGHPDTICDALAETLSRNLCRYYLDRFGKILHHNVDKALLCGGSAIPAFGGGEVLTPVEIYLCGRAVSEADGLKVPLDEIVAEGSRSWLKAKLHGFDLDKHVRFHNLVRPGSVALQQLFDRAKANSGVPFANDTSFGVGYAAVSALERLVLRVDELLGSGGHVAHHRAWGEDSKVMGAPWQRCLPHHRLRHDRPLPGRCRCLCRRDTGDPAQGSGPCGRVRLRRLPRTGQCRR
jgi:S-adenosylmethionine synthetase